MYQNFIGIDIGKDEFYVALHDTQEAKAYLNNSAGFSRFVEDYIKDLPDALVVLETTGGYESALIKRLQADDYHVHRANTLKVKHFIRSLGKLGKTDPIDACGLAHYGAERHKTLQLYVENPRKKLLKLISRRADLTKMMVKEKNRLKAPDQDGLESSFQTIINALKTEREEIDERIKCIYDNDPALAELKNVLATVPGIGEVVASTLLAFMPELGTVNRRQIASLGGVAPHPNDSGSRRGYRSTRGGRPEVKNILFIAAMAASKGKSRLGSFYKSLVASGKKKMVALTALMRKILVIANARIKEFLDNKTLVIDN